MGVGAQAFCRLLNADQIQKFQDPGTGPFGLHILVQGQNLADLVFDHVQGVQRRHRLLKDHRDLVAPGSVQGGLVRAQQFLTPIDNRAGGVGRGWVGQQL